jgi:hypothetical protein
MPDGRSFISESRASVTYKGPSFLRIHGTCARFLKWHQLRCTKWFRWHPASSGLYISVIMTGATVLFPAFPATALPDHVTSITCAGYYTGTRGFLYFIRGTVDPAADRELGRR